ncbi:E3 ubiquitin/ISG15 ligase TRIM25-like isoform X1 [Tachysurus fulvidraco]|uniref:E3 ubiquitin/ISG15 ligase TRIM25-like isoform X1 n=1 Tax=Tachysurus fulvidraco TaxID=1234273 RepID=UPI001FEE1371|nr:E3 ubiquitin/ISG15 ligase TRIM25-like isoform X1 [Tachysurus fulvidraco]XP_047672303.1 E3 ubiquitin/ISG15 ligase TRIM25-like isoform X1 [Tachysurus fulvidraco]
MATALEDTSVLEKELTCPVCLDLYREPHLLRCGHNFCLQCLQRLKSLSEHGRLRCPECRKSDHCYKQWQKNFKLASIADGFRRCSRSQRPNQSRPGSSYRTTEVCCDYCGPNITGDSAKRSRAVKTCLKCEVSMCPEHVKHHLELPAFSMHPLVEPLSDIRKRKCIEHDKMFRYYCMDDRKFLCNACTIEGKHNSHAIRTLKNTMKDLRGSLDTQLQKVDKKIRRVEKNVQKQRELEQQNKALLVQMDRQMDTLRGVLMTRLDGFLSSLRKSVRSFQWENSLNIQQYLVQTEEDWSRLGVVQAEINQLLQENDPFQFIKEYMSFAKSYHRLLKRPLFQPQAVTMDIKERMERKRDDFMTELRDHITIIINTVCTGGSVNDGDEVVEEWEMEDDSDVNEDENDSSDGDEEQEEEVHDHSDSASYLSTEEEGELELGVFAVYF